MRELTYFELLSPFPIEVNGVGYLIPPTIKSIYDLGVNEYSQNKYDGIFNTLCIDIQKYFEITGNLEIYNSLSNKQKSELNIYDYWVSSENNLKVIKKSLSFFIKGSMSYNKITCEFEIYDNDKLIGVINRNNFNYICKLIKQLNYIEDPNLINGRPKNKSAADILFKINNGQKLIKNKHENNKDINIANIISAVSAQDIGYNMINIWSLTIYQLYDQFFRLNCRKQIEISALRWAAWGQENFDYDLWFKSIK